MEVTTDTRKRLQKLMLIQRASQRDVAAAAGWRAHSYLGRLLRGEVDSLDTDAAVRIAHYFGVSVDDLFVTKSSSQAEPHAQQNGAKR